MTTENTVAHRSAGRDPVGSYIVADICTHNSDNVNNYEPQPEEAH